MSKKGMFFRKKYIFPRQFRDILIFSSANPKFQLWRKWRRKVKNYLDFTNKKAVVTGGRRGLGRAMALALAERGATVTAISRNPEPGDLMREIEQAGGKGFYLSADLSDPAARAGLISKAAKQMDGIDILINNAGLQFNDTAESCSPEHWKVSQSVLLDAVFDLSQEAIPHMKAQKSGKIIQISSICAFREGGWNFSYGVMKSALTGMTRYMANSLARYGINVNAIAPGIVRTGLTELCFSSKEIYESQCRKYPAGRLGEPEEIAAVMLFLASDMSSFLNGQTIVADGGFCGN